MLNPLLGQLNSTFDQIVFTPPIFLDNLNYGEIGLHQGMASED